MSAPNEPKSARTPGPWVLVPKEDLDPVVNSVIGNTSGTLYQRAMALRQISDNAKQHACAHDILLAQRDALAKVLRLVVDRIPQSDSGDLADVWLQARAALAGGE